MFSTIAGESSLHDLNSLLSSLSLENVSTQITRRLDYRRYCYKNKSCSIADLKNSIINIKIPNSIQTYLKTKYICLRTQII
uniref:THAP-type domain-containing protein n=1 Tax=Strongyloides venezuelensis TaxID=75913 RepID=A0A0K0FPW9_STRVS